MDEKINETLEETASEIQDEILENAGDNGESAELPEPEIAEEPSELDKLRAEVETYKAIAFRTQADFDNYRKRNQELARSSRYDGKADVVSEVLPVLDNFGRAVAVISDESTKEGVLKIAKQLESALTKLGVTEIEAEGLQFNPDLHNAVLTEEVDGVEEGMVTEVLMKGYKLDGKVIRYAMVKVAK